MLSFISVSFQRLNQVTTYGLSLSEISTFKNPTSYNYFNRRQSSCSTNFTELKSVLTFSLAEGICQATQTSDRGFGLGSNTEYRKILTPTHNPETCFYLQPTGETRRHTDSSPGVIRATVCNFLI